LARRAVALVLEHLNFLAFAAGFATMYWGVAALSRPAANIVAGLLIMALAAAPYTWVRRG
jgi:hypothetical protein